MSTTALLLLADGRLPAGGHAHSGGIEAAVRDGRVHDLSTLESFLRGRLRTAALVAAAFAAVACQAGRDALLTPGVQHGVRRDAGARAAELDAAYDARTPSPALRRASRAQGRALLRAGAVMWTLPACRPDTHHAVALGIVAAAAGLRPRDAALAAVHGSVSGPAAAAVRLLALDPYPVQRVLARLSAECDETANVAAGFASADADDLPAASAPLLDIGAEAHASWEVRLFAS
jgi:urease accessory protein